MATVNNKTEMKSEMAAFVGNIDGFLLYLRNNWNFDSTLNNHHLWIKAKTDKFNVVLGKQNKLTLIIFAR